MSFRLEQIAGERRGVRAGRSAVDRLRIASMFGHAHLRNGGAGVLFRWLPSAADPPRDVSLRDGRSVRARRQDGIVFYEHFGLDVYDVGLPLGKVTTIVDLGANIGFATMALARHHPDAAFVCVEPSPESRALLEENVRRNGVPARIYGVAVSGTRGRFQVDVADYAAANQMTPDTAGTIEGITLADLLERAEIDEVDLLKIDIEGAERGVFETADAWAPRVRALVGELHDGLTPAWVAERIGPHGFVEVALPDEARFHGLICFARIAPRA